MGHLEELEARLTELAEAGGVGWYPEDFLDQLRRPEVRETVAALEEQVHHPATAQLAVRPPGIPDELIDYPVEGLHRFFFYVPGEIVVASEVRDLVAARLGPRLRPEQQYGLTAPLDTEAVAGYEILHVDTEGSTVPALAYEQHQMLVEEFGPDHNLVAPHHIYTAGPMHCGGPGNNPDNKTADHRDLVPLPEPSGNAGYGVLVAVLDTGILPASELPGWVKSNVVFDAPNDVETEYSDVVDGEQFVRYPRVHGTFVTGILLQTAPGATILMKQLLNKLGTATDAELGMALEYVLNRPNGVPQIINLSLGCPSWNDNPPPILAAAFRQVVSHDPPIIVVAAAGNAGSTDPFWPAASPEPRVLGVGAVNRKGQRSEFSNFGPPVKVWALGEDVTSVYASGVFRRESEGILHRPFAGLAAWGGTSFAAPRVAGLIAKAVTELNLTLEQAAQHVLNTPPARATDTLPLPVGHDHRHVPLVLDGLDPI